MSACFFNNIILSWRNPAYGWPDLDKAMAFDLIVSVEFSLDICAAAPGSGSANFRRLRGREKLACPTIGQEIAEKTELHFNLASLFGASCAWHDIVARWNQLRFSIQIFSTETELQPFTVFPWKAVFINLFKYFGISCQFPKFTPIGPVGSITNLALGTEDAAD